MSDVNKDSTCGLNLDINKAACAIFDDIYNKAIQDFREDLKVINENRRRLIWKDEMEREKKIWSSVASFQKAIKDSLVSSHAEAAKHIEGSTCDLFLAYLNDKFNQLLGEDLFRFLLDDIKEQIVRKILRLKNELEEKHTEEPPSESVLEDWIAKTDLFHPIHIHHALLCRQLARDCKNPENRTKNLEEIEKKHLLSNVYVSYENKDVPKYVMAECGDVIYVSFNGLSSLTSPGAESTYRGEILSSKKFKCLRYFLVLRHFYLTSVHDVIQRYDFCSI